VSADLADNAVTTSKIAANAVSSAKITDGTILDVDVSNVAAIAGTKILPNFGAQDLTTTGKASIGNLATPDAALTVFGRIKVSTDETIPGRDAIEVLAGGVGTGHISRHSRDSPLQLKPGLRVMQRFRR
jgi:hypothetical protein